MKKIILFLFISFNVFGYETYYETLTKNNNFLISHKALGNGCISTLDVAINEMTAKDSFIVDYNHATRTQGVMMSVYLSGGVGPTQWNHFPGSTRIILMPGTIHIPIDQWVKEGLQVDDNHIVRVVLIKDTKC